jgi:hypothetical protein
MDLSQRKLNKTEWDGIEIPQSINEKRIIKLLCNAFNDVNLKRNHTLSLLKHLKINNSPEIDSYVYCNYIQHILKTLCAKHKVPYIDVSPGKASIKKKDKIRFSNTDKKLEQNKNCIFEFIIIKLLTNMFITDNEKQIYFNYYTIKTLMTYSIELCNQHFIHKIGEIMKHYENQIDIKKALYYGYDIIEKNDYLLRYADEELYVHQKQLFTLCKHSGPKLISYIAPTGTGKTFSPLGLSEQHRVIFVCAARHVGLALARAAISQQKKIAFAFGCGDAEDIRLHYYSVKECIRNKRTGGIRKVDNSVGDDVEIMISDIKSFLPAMYYMLAFNPKEKIILYWDEPTITLDYEQHEFHDIIKKNWQENLIPNVVLSSATLPQPDEIAPTIADFRTRFHGGFEKYETEDGSIKERELIPEVHSIISYDCKKTIPLFTKEGHVSTPHLMSSDYTKIQEIAAHCEKYKTLLRYIDLNSVIKFIKYVNENNCLTSKRYYIERHFPDIQTISMVNIKEYYLLILKNLKPELWTTVYTTLNEENKLQSNSYIKFVTEDAHTLTDGPAIYLAKDVNKMAKYCIKLANIPSIVLADIMQAIQYNSTINEKISELQKQYEDGTRKDEDKENKMAEGRVNPEMRQLMSNITTLQGCIKSMALNPMFIPNTYEHRKRYNMEMKNNTFTCDIDESIVEQIMLIDDIEDIWKLLLLMGIGVFTSHKSVRYIEIMKNLANQQKLYLIIASDDYIYGTNYQFCHAYISKDLGNISQEKLIQALGRAGRNRLQQTYSIRFRENELIEKLFTTQSDKPEVQNMRLLFNT